MSTSGSSNGPATPGGVAGQQSDPRQAAPGMDLAFEPDEKAKESDPEKEEKLVAKLWRAYDDSRKFDENFRKQVAIDRRYAAGTSDLSWAVTTNLIGAFIDILVALLYARDPDVSVRKAAQVSEAGTLPMENFAKTLEIVISHLWKKGKLKKAARKAVRSVLSNAEGWLKCTLISEKVPDTELQVSLNDARELQDRLVAQQKLIEDPQGMSPDELDAKIEEKRVLIESLETKLEQNVNKFFAIDFIKTENMQVSTDVESVSDYLEANWVGNELYLEKEDVLTRFPRLTASDISSAKIYYQKPPKEMTTRDIDNVLPQGMLTAETAQAFVTSTSTPESPSFLRVVEIWDRTDRHVRTMIDGVKKWAKEPFQPPYPTSRFYPYFHFSFYEVDGERHPQSLSWRLYKLQDEYSSVRSNFRLTRERAIPGTLFNATGLDETEAKKLTESKHQEYTALRPSDPNIPLANLFAPKPVSAIDPRLYDPSYILSDMERLSGVQEALSAAVSGPGNPRTATEASIQQSGTNARTSADRDNIEEMLSEMAQYTAEQSLQCMTIPEVQRIAGPKAFWPEGMSIDDLFTLAEVSISAGTTGKPRTGADQNAWATILPMIKETIGQIEQALATGNLPLANALTELIRETMLRLGDETDASRFIPNTPPPGSPGAGAPPQPPPPKVSITLKGDLPQGAAAQLIGPTVQQDTALMQPPPPPVPGPAPAGPSGPSAAAPGPGAGPMISP